MNTLAWHDGGPGPWILLMPLVWIAVVTLAVTVLRRTPWRGDRWRGGAWPGRALGGDEYSPLAVLGRRFAAGDIDEEEYWRRMSVLEEHFARAPRGPRGGAA